MHTGAKVNLYKYGAFSAVLLMTEYFLARSPEEFQAMVVVFIAACVNQLMLVKMVRTLISTAVSGKAGANTTVLSLGKIFILVGALIYSVQIMGSRVIIPLLIYVLQIAVLYLSFQKTKTLKNIEQDKELK